MSTITIDHESSGPFVLTFTSWDPTEKPAQRRHIVETWRFETHREAMAFAARRFVSLGKRDLRKLASCLAFVFPEDFCNLRLDYLKPGFSP